MNFFEAQESARRRTRNLVLFFALAVLSLIVVTNLLVMVLFGFLHAGDNGVTLQSILAQFNWRAFLTIGAIVSAVILCGSLYKSAVLASGGAVVAESLGGRLISPNTADLHERKALNVVEEMSIASGTPVPFVYLLDHEQGINAFAAGFTPGDAVIGLTRGTIHFLDRDELQGVVAHEFSHILHGDMPLNMRLIGILHGILLIGLIGYYILRSMRRGRSRDSAPIIGLGIGLMVVGYAGTFFGNLIKASVSRQREFLADASAVQFTRNPLGIAGALRKIGGYAAGSELTSAQAPSMSHAYFSNGISSFLQSMFATHPPLETRIRRVDPQWDGQFPVVTQEVDDSVLVHGADARDESKRKAAVTGVVLASQVLDGIGQTGPDQIEYAASVIRDIPEKIRNEVHDPYGARAVIYCLVIDARHAEVEDLQRKRLTARADSGISDLVGQLLPQIQRLDIRYRLPLIDMAMPALRRLSPEQYQMFKSNLLYLVRADQRIDMFEWSLQKIVFHHLDSHYGKPSKRVARFGALRDVKEDIDVLISMLLHACVRGDAEQRKAFAAARAALGLVTLDLLPRDRINLDNLESAVDRLALLKPLLKPFLLKACMAAITRDQHYSPEEMELMRALGDVLDCPIPLFVQSETGHKQSPRGDERSTQTR